MILELILSVLLFLLGMHKYLSRNYDYWRQKGVPYIKPTPFFGNITDFFTFKKSLGDCLYKLYKKFDEPFFGVFIMDKPYLVIKDPELIKHVLIKDFNHFFDRYVLSNEKTDSLAAHMLFFSKNPEWKYMRNKMTPVFTSGKMKKTFYLVQQVGDNMVRYLNEQITHGDVEVKHLFTMYSTNVTTSYAFGLDTQIFQQPNGPFEKAAKTMFYPDLKNGFCQATYFIAHDLAELLSLPFFNTWVSNFLRETFWRSLDERVRSNVARHDILDVLKEFKQQPRLNDNFMFEGDKVLAQAVQFFAAGSETVSTAMAFTLYELSLHPKIQTKLRLEVKNKLEKHSEITYDSINEMTYLNMVVHEALRKYPVLPFLDRKCMQDYQLPNTEFVIPAGMPILISVLGLHYDTSYYRNPEKFDPERFSEENINNVATYLPFGTGPRNCAGERFGLLSTKLGLINIIKNFEVEPCLKTPKRINFSSWTFLLASNVGLPLKFTKISN